MYYTKYIKYKTKYLNLKQKQIGGTNTHSILQQYYNGLTDLYTNYTEPEPTNYTKNIDYDNIFTGPFLLDEIKNNLKVKELISKKYNKLVFITDNINSPIYNTLVKRTLILSQFLNITKKVIVIYLDSNHIKQLPEPNKIINKENVNSGYSTNYYTVVYRREEAKKVLIHELLHQFEVDCGYTCAKQNNELDYYILYNEALVETLATILNCMMTDIEEQTNNYIKCIENEKIFITKQVKQIMNHLKIINITDKIIAKASILEYYIMKSAILHNLDDFINFLITNNNNLFIYDRSQDKNKLYHKILEYTTSNKFKYILKQTEPNNTKSMKMTTT